MIYGGTLKLPLGSDLPDFWLPDVEGIIVPKDHLMGASAILVIFMCNCGSYVNHIRQVLVKMIWEYQQRGIAVVAINSNDIVSHPEDCPDQMKEVAQTYGYTFPYLFDGTQEVAKQFRVLVTPDFFLFNKQGKLAYHGRMDESAPGNGKAVTGKDLRNALNALLLGQDVAGYQFSGNGTDIKWRPGHEPEYICRLFRNKEQESGARIQESGEREENHNN